MSDRTINATNAGEVFLEVLADRDIGYLFGNAGTDFPSIIEAFAKAEAGEARAPMAVTVPHENLAVSMAHGAYLATGRPQAVMLHVNVGTANAICALLNAARENVPVFLVAGRTPVAEAGPVGARSVFIHWGQEMFDQAGMLREIVKWDYELRRPEQMEAAVDRALAIAMSQPRGPVYLTLPREVLGASRGGTSLAPASTRTPASPPSPNAEAIGQAATWLAAARSPIIVTASYGRDPGDVPTLAELAERYAIPVVGYRPRYVFLPTAHPMHMGYDPGSLLARSDLIVALECDVPWIPTLHEVNPRAKIVHLGVDPLFSRYPMRSFRSDLAIAGDPRAALEALGSALRGKVGTKTIQARRTATAKLRIERDERRRSALASVPAGGISTGSWVAAALDKVKRVDDVLVTETPFPIDLMELSEPGTFFGTSPAGGLGWGLGAALGLKLGRPERRVIALVGDGSYMFGNPTPAHFVSAAYGLPFLTIILNNRMWGAVRRATLAMYPDGAAARSNRAPLTYLEPSPLYHKIVEASGGYGEEVARAEDLPAALERALHAVEEEKRQAVLNVTTGYTDSDAVRDARR